ncbi:GntR family transcriptional regulator [Paenibacillus sp. GCM10027626]|uniref:GntR family transcriptional regulator n=1 Tax=Paenibacillus sp. GCM10027626 TaxID=3273411 RepID=UPI0036347B8C
MNANKGQLSRSFFSSQVLSELRNAIISGKLPAGEKIVESSIAEQMGVSRGPVRNALFILENEGLITFLPTGRTVSNGFSLNDAEKLYEMRAFLELKSIELLFTEKALHFHQIKHINDELKKNQDDVSEFTRLDVSYHHELIRLSGNKYLLQSWLSLCPLIESVLTITNARFREKGADGWDKGYVIDHHEKILTALMTGNLGNALLFLKEHLDIGKQTMLGQLEEIVK